MIFNSFQYIYFILSCAGIYYLLPYRTRNAFILLASLVSCFYWNWVTGTVFIFQVTCTYLYAYRIDREENGSNRKRWYGLSIATLLLTLCLFKYAAPVSKKLFPFLLSSLENLPSPVGISFYTFMCLGYLYDIYSGRLKPNQRASSFVSFFAFFPHFSSGPIGRYADVSSQLLAKHSCLPEQMSLGGRLILWGLFKKMVIADRLAQFTAPVFFAPEESSGFTCLVAMYFYAMQIYCDFSGYSDIAIGSAKLFGINLRQNFNQPYFATSIYDFWKRWHISLTSWFRDYLYIPLGGNRVSTLHWLANIMAVFLLSGLWHGASWTFAIWGGIHGIVYLLELFIKQKLSCRQFSSKTLSILLHPFKIFLTFNIVSIAWVFFRSPDMASAFRFLGNILFRFDRFNWGSSKIPTALSFALIAMLLASELLIAIGWSGDYLRHGRCPDWLKYLGYGILLMAIALIGVRSETFVYLQF